jgi:hypothetical protein
VTTARTNLRSQSVTAYASKRLSSDAHFKDRAERERTYRKELVLEEQLEFRESCPGSNNDVWPGRVTEELDGVVDHFVILQSTEGR